MWALGLDTSSETFHAAIAEPLTTSWRYLARCDRPLGRQTSALAHVLLYELWQQAGSPPWSALGFVAVAIGPGSFTGTRVGVVAARVLGQQLNVPVFAMAQAESEGQELLAWAWRRWQRGERPAWSIAYPLYGSP